MFISTSFSILEHSSTSCGYFVCFQFRLVIIISTTVQKHHLQLHLPFLLVGHVFWFSFLSRRSRITRYSRGTIRTIRRWISISSRTMGSRPTPIVFFSIVTSVTFYCRMVWTPIMFSRISLWSIRSLCSFITLIPNMATLLKQLVGRLSLNRDKVADTYSIPNPGITVIPTFNSMTFIPYG